MSKSPNLELYLTPQTTDETFLDWRLRQNGTGSDSNMMKLDQAYSNLETKKANKVVEAATEPDNLAVGDEWDRLL